MLLRATGLHAIAWIFLALASTTSLAHPGCGIVVDSGQVYFIDTGHGVWKIDRDKKLTSLGGPPQHFLTIDRENRFSQEHFGRLARGDVTVLANQPTLIVGSSYPVAIGSDGAFYYPRVFERGRVQIMKMAAGKRAQPFALLPRAKEIGPDGEEIQAEWIWGLAAGPDGTLFYSEKKAVRRISIDGAVSTVAENVTVPDCERHVTAMDERLGPGLYGLAVAPNGSVYVAASACSALLKMSADGGVSVVLRATGGWSPQGVAVDGENVYVLEYHVARGDRREDWLPRVRQIAPDGGVNMLAEIKKR